MIVDGCRMTDHVIMHGNQYIKIGSIVLLTMY